MLYQAGMTAMILLLALYGAFFDPSSNRVAR
jgi:hypothetical protein